MGASLFEKIQARIELFRLEQRYTRRRNRRSTFQSNAIYVDGEYVYQTPSSTGSSSTTTTTTAAATPTRINALHEPEPVPEEILAEAEVAAAAAEARAAAQQAKMMKKKKKNRLSAMPGFGPSGPKLEPAQDWRPSRASFDGSAR